MITPAQKREQTLEKKFGPDWRKKVGQMAKEAREKKFGKTRQYSEAGKKGGASRSPESRAFSKDKELASAAGKKGAQKRWGSDNG